jgi:hypothetical protein
MPARNPRNQVKTNLYTQGGEFIYKSTGLDYVGYYYTINNKAYAGTDPVTSRIITVKETSLSIPVIKQVEPIELDINPNSLSAGADTNILHTVGNVAGFFTEAYNFAKSNLETAQYIKDKVFPSKTITNAQPRVGLHYFIQNSTDQNKIIKETDLTSYNQLQKDPVYKTVSIDFLSPDAEKQIEDGEKIIPGLKTFINL